MILSPAAFNNGFNSGLNVAKAKKFAVYPWMSSTLFVYKNRDIDSSYNQCVLPTEFVVWKKQFICSNFVKFVDTCVSLL